MRLYELREKAIHDEVTRMAGAREEGREKGRLEETRRVALSLLSQNVSVDIIKKATGLTEDEIKELKNNL